MPNLNWYFPVAGETEYSGGSWMPDSLTHRGRTHPAIDMYAAAGTPIIAPVSGVVQKVGSSDIGGYNLTLLGDDGITYYFAHMGQQATATKGQRLGIGSMFGVVGNSGSAKKTKAHLHFKMSKNGHAINPKRYLDVGYRMPDYAAFASIGIPDPYEQQQAYPQPGQLGYVDPFTVAENAIADSDPVEPVSEFSPEAFLATAMDTMSMMATGGQPRVDYRNMGTRNVQRSLIPTKVAVDEGGDDGTQEG